MVSCRSSTDKGIMTEGTKSYLFGCHQFLAHPLVVILAWKKLYNTYPKPWEIVCIFLHDVGHIGKNYLSDYEQKKEHWKLGANIAYRLFRSKGFYLVAGHDVNSELPRSQLFWADKYSWLVAPRWWLESNIRVEGFTYNVDEFLEKAKENWDKGCPTSTHQVYLDLTKEKQINAPYY